MKKLAWIGLFTLFTTWTFGQDYYDEIFEKAEESLYREDFESALGYYEQLKESELNYGNRIYYKAELCSLLTKYKNKSLDTFLQFEEEMIKEDKFYYYWKGRVLLGKYEMEAAEASLLKFLKTRAYLSPEIRKEAHTWIKWSRNARKFMDNPGSFEIHLLESGINTEFGELSPVFFAGNEELLFASNRGDDPNKFQIYHARHTGEREWSEPTLLSELGSFERDNVNIEVVAQDGKLFQFSTEKGGDLFFSEPVGDMSGWTAPKEFDSRISNSNLESHFFINEREDRIIFASNRGSKKSPNLDLMESFKDPKTGNWSKPKTMDFIINSPHNEDSPYLSADEKTLYFASDGHKSMGGYDIFYSTFDEISKTWSEPKNLGFPLNSPEDELHFKLNPDQTSGYFSSNRLNTLGDFDIFFFWEIDMIELDGMIVDNETGFPVKDAEILFRPEAYLDMYFKADIDEYGIYSASVNRDDIYHVEIKKDGKILYDKFFELHIKDGESIAEKNFFLGEKDIHEEVEIMAAQIRTDAPDRGIVTEEMQLEELGTKFRVSNKVEVRHIYFDTGTSHLKEESIPTLEILFGVMDEFPDLTIKIDGHTDIIGSKELNQRLSLERAEAVKSWLIERGVYSERMTTKGYGSSLPLASNDDELEGRELNRRIEISVVENSVAYNQ